MTSKPSLKFLRVGAFCCGDDWTQTESSRYDMERLGCVVAPQEDEANLLVIQGTLNAMLSAEVKKVYENMRSPKYVLSIGSCACGGGLFPVEHEIPVDIYVTGCPPRPEAIMNGILSLKEMQK